jgi:hypothetical protein
MLHDAVAQQACCQQLQELHAAATSKTLQAINNAHSQIFEASIAVAV